METEEFIILQEIKAAASSFLRNLKIGDKVVVELGDSIYREAVIESESYSAPSGATYIEYLCLIKFYQLIKDMLYLFGTYIHQVVRK